MSCTFSKFCKISLIHCLARNFSEPSFYENTLHPIFSSQSYIFHIILFFSPAFSALVIVRQLRILLRRQPLHSAKLLFLTLAFRWRFGLKSFVLLFDLTPHYFRRQETSCKSGKTFYSCCTVMRVTVRNTVEYFTPFYAQKSSLSSLFLAQNKFSCGNCKRNRMHTAQ